MVPPGCLVVATLAAVTACSPFAGELSIDSVDPMMGPSTTTVDITLHGSFPGRIRADVDTGKTRTLPLSLVVRDAAGTEVVLDARQLDDETVETTLPAGLSPGPVTFELAVGSGSEARRVSAADEYRVFDPPLGAWGTPTPLFPTTTIDDDPTLTGDLLELYFNRDGDIYVTTRPAVGAAWSLPARVDVLSTVDNETTPEITSDGLTIFIASGRAGSVGSDDIWVSTRPDRAAAWSAPIRVAELSSPVAEAAAAPTDDLRAIVFISPRADGLGNADIYLSERAQPGDAWGVPRNLMSINTPGNDYSPMLSQDKRTLYWDAATAGSSDLYLATRASTADEFMQVTPIDELNTSGAENDPWVSPDRRHIVFVRDNVLYEASR